MLTNTEVNCHLTIWRKDAILTAKMLVFCVRPGSLVDALVHVDTQVPDQWKMMNCMEIKLNDNDVEGTSTIFYVNAVIAEK